MSSQNWIPVVLKKKISKTTEIKKGNFVTEHKQSDETIHQRSLSSKLENDEDFKLPIVTHELKIQLQQARNQKGLTQAQLANKCQLPVKIIQDLEKGTGIIHSAHLVLINKILDTKLKKPKVSK